MLMLSARQYVSECDILRPISKFCDIENVVSLIEDNSFK